MSKAVAFFPWVHIDEPLQLGDLRLLPFRPGEAPGNQRYVTQSVLDKIFSAYADRPNKLVQNATILEWGDWHCGMDDAQISPRLFQLQHILAFAALSKRQLFGPIGYVNSDAYSLVIQRFNESSAGTFAFTTRRRDGRTSSLWGSDEFAFQRPLHVQQGTAIDFDVELAKALIKLGDSEPNIFEAIEEFNSANTDATTTPVHVEIVMIKSAFEWLFSISQRSGDLLNALRRTLPAYESRNSGPLAHEWADRWPKTERPILAWAQEFCAVRGGAAHGSQRENNSYVLRSESHLALASIVFPLILKSVLAEKGKLTLSKFDQERLKQIDSYASHDPFSHDPYGASPHPWRRLDSAAGIHELCDLFSSDELGQE